MRPATPASIANICTMGQISRATRHTYRRAWNRRSLVNPKVKWNERVLASTRGHEQEQEQEDGKVKEERDFDLGPLIQFLREDLTHLFDDQGIDQSRYTPNVDFEDPITKHSNLGGYLANIAFLKKVFAPTFTLLDIRATGRFEITTRWAMEMKPTFTRLLPGVLQRYWNPVLNFTGTSILTVDPYTQRFSSHIDTWDSISNQKYFSLEAFYHVLSQIFDFRRVPLGLEAPRYQLLLKRSEYEVRKYFPMIVVETVVEEFGSEETKFQQRKAFGRLVNYISGRNASNAAVNMTTPVLSGNGKMQFYLRDAELSSSNGLPKPLESSNVILRDVPSQLMVVKAIGGVATEEKVHAATVQLRDLVEKDGISVAGSQPAVLARYNDPSTPPLFRRNEILLPINESTFKLW